MVDVTKDGTAPEEDAPMGGLMKPVANPLFGGDVKSLVVTRDVHLHQLLHEIDTRLGDRDTYQVVLDVKDYSALVSEANPLTVHVHPATVDLPVVQAVVDAHTPDPHHGKTEQEKEIDSLKARLAEGDLALPELNKILRSILGG